MTREQSHKTLVEIYSRPIENAAVNWMMGDNRPADYAAELADRMCEYVYDGKSDEDFIDGQHVEGSLYPAGDFNFRASAANRILANRGSETITW